MYILICISVYLIIKYFMEMKDILKTWRSIKSLTCETQSLVYLYASSVKLSVFASQDMRKQTEFDICHLTASGMNTTVLPSCIYMLNIRFCLHIREIVIKYSVLSFIHILWQLLLSIIIDRNSSTFMDGAILECVVYLCN